MKKNLIKIFLYALSIFAATNLLGNDQERLEISISPNPIIQNAQANFIIDTTKSGKISSVSFPQIDGIQWLEHIHQNSSSHSWVNGKTTTKSSESFGFVVTKSGEIEIPSFKISASNGEFFTRPIRITAGKATSGIFDSNGNEIEISDAVFMRARIENRSRKTFFVGEEIPISVAILSNPKIHVEVSAFPKVLGNDELFVSDSKNISEGKGVINGENFDALIFTKTVHATKPGTFKLEFEVDANCTLPSSGANDSFSNIFSGAMRINAFGNRSRSVFQKLKYALEPFEIKPRPPIPNEIFDLGIISNGEIFGEFSDGKNAFPLDENSQKIKQGAPLYLDLFADFGNATAVVPEISIEKFRVYPPEILEISNENFVEKFGKDSVPENSKNLRQVRWMLGPLSLGTAKIDLKFARLDPESGDYKIFNVSKNFEIETDKSLKNISGTAENFSAAGTTNSDENLPQKISENPQNRFLKNRQISAETLEKENSRAKIVEFSKIAGALFAPLALIFGVFVERRRARRSKISSDPNLSRKENARSRKKEILKKLEAANAENFDELVRTEIADYVSDVTGTNDKSALKNKEVAEIFSAVEIAGYNPEAKNSNFEKARKILINAIRKSAFLLLFIVVSAGTFPKEILGNEEKIDFEAEILAAQNAYSEGDFSVAIEKFSALTKSFPHSADLWLNLGNSFFQNREFAKALACYERCRVEDFSNSEALENLNAACRALGVPERNLVKNPIDFFAALRDFLASETWSILGALAVLLGVLIGLNVKKSRFRKCFFYVLGVAIFLFCRANVHWQERVFEEKMSSAILLGNADLKNLPLENSSQKIAEIPSGTTVKILEKRGNFSLVKVDFPDGDFLEGWLENSKFVEISSPEFSE